MGQRCLGAALVILLAVGCGGNTFETLSSAGGDQGAAGDTGGNAGTGGHHWGGGGATGKGGATGIGGDTAAGGDTSAGGSTAAGGDTAAGGSTGTGGDTAGGGSTGTGGAVADAGTDGPPTCIDLRKTLDVLLARAQACTGNDPSECTTEVGGLCCQPVVASATSAATKEYTVALDKFISGNCMTACPLSMCPTGAGTCTFDTVSHTGTCTRSGGPMPY